MATLHETLLATGNLSQVSLVNPILDEGYEKESAMDHMEISYRHTSFHGSGFPLDDKRACPRAALYEMMAIPSDGTIDRRGRAVMDAGTDLEHRIVWRLEYAGRLLSPSPQFQQWSLEVPSHWLVVHPDAAVLPFGWKSALVVEIKGKDHQVVQDMKAGIKSYDPWHRNQLMAQIGSIRENWAKLQRQQSPAYQDLTGIDPPSSGVVLYVSRQRPSLTHEFFFPFEPDAYQQGLDTLQSWKNAFLDDHLPERDPAWKWSEEPCGWCDVKKICKADDKAGVTRLSETCGVKRAVETYAEPYSVADIRAAVLKRWNEDDRA